VFCTTDGWTIAFPMKKGNEAHKAISLLCHIYGVPNVMVMDVSKARVQGAFRWKLFGTGCHIQQNERYTAKSNLGEGGVGELK
jgi:hypothetical protein